MSKPKIVVVIPTIREAQYKSFIEAWKPLFTKHEVTLVTVWDGETPRADVYSYSKDIVETIDYKECLYSIHKKLIYRYADACRNLGFIVAAQLKPDYVLTLDDDVQPAVSYTSVLGRTDDPIQSHLDVLQKRVPLGWINTAHDTELYLRGVPYNIRNEAPVMLSHGVWVGTPDFDGETQLKLEQDKWTADLNRDPIEYLDSKNHNGVPYSLPYYVGSIPKGVLFPLCGMNVMVRAEALPYLYFAPMGADTKVEGLNRFSDIWMGISLKKKFDELGWACYTGGSTILHTRASDAKKNFEQEKLGRQWNEYITNYVEQDSKWGSDLPSGFVEYMTTYRRKREQFADLITSIFSQ